MTKIFCRRSLSRKLIWCRDLIRRKSEKIFTRKQYRLEEEGAEREEAGGGGREEKDDEEEAGEADETEEGNQGINDLPDDVMLVIMQRLSLSDHLYCRNVSACWRAQIDSKRWLPAAYHQLPWLLSSHYTDMQTFNIKTHVDHADDGDDYYSFVSDRKVCKKNMDCGIDYFYFWYCLGAIEGWLLMVSRTLSGGTSLFLLNPVSAARVMLPLRPYPIPPIRKVVASSVPTTPKCYVTCLHYVERRLLAFCMPDDRSWTLIEAEKALGFSDIEILDGKLYAVGNYVLEFVMVFDIHLDTCDSRLHTYTSQRLVTLHPTIKSILAISVCRRNCYLAKCSVSKDLFMILYNQDPCTPSQHNEFEFEGLFHVLKLENNVTTGSQWVEIEDLGDRVLFMGTLNNMFMTPHDKTLERNCIYFALWKQGLDGKELYSGMFSLTDRSIKPMNIPKHHPCREGSETIWFTPTPWH